MKLSIKEMNEHFASEILQWQYVAPYDFYNNELSGENVQEMLDNPYFAIFNNHSELIGYYCTGKAAQVPKGQGFGAYEEHCIDIGIGLKPNLTGQGLGTAFFSFIVQTVQEEYQLPLRLTVALFNKRAIHLYEKFGFLKAIEFSTPTEFVTMVKKM